MTSSIEFQIELEESQRILKTQKNLLKEIFKNYSRVLSNVQQLNEEQRELEKKLYEITHGNSNLPKTVIALKTNIHVQKTLCKTFKSKLRNIEEINQQFNNGIQELKEKNQNIIYENYKNNILAHLPNLIKMKNNLHEEINQLRTQVENERKNLEEEVKMKNEFLIKLINDKKLENDKIRDEMNLIEQNENQLEILREISNTKDKNIEELEAKCKEIEEKIQED